MERKRVLSNFQRWAEIGPFISGALSQGATTFAHHRLLIVASPLAEALHFISSPAYPCAHHRLLIVASPLAEALSFEKAVLARAYPRMLQPARVLSHRHGTFMKLGSFAVRPHGRTVKWVRFRHPTSDSESVRKPIDRLMRLTAHLGLHWMPN
jgi:hypothetical protein